MAKSEVVCSEFEEDTLRALLWTMGWSTAYDSRKVFDVAITHDVNTDHWRGYVYSTKKEAGDGETD